MGCVRGFDSDNKCQICNNKPMIICYQCGSIQQMDETCRGCKSRLSRCGIHNWDTSRTLGYTCKNCDLSIFPPDFPSNTYRSCKKGFSHDWINNDENKFICKGCHKWANCRTWDNTPCVWTINLPASPSDKHHWHLVGSSNIICLRCGKYAQTS